MMEYEANLISKKSGKFERDRLDYLNVWEFNWKKTNTTTNNNNHKKGCEYYSSKNKHAHPTSYNNTNTVQIQDHVLQPQTDSQWIATSNKKT